MNNKPMPHIFWGKYSPLAMLSGVGLLIMASSRLAYALIAALALLWVDVMSVLVYKAAYKVMPREGKHLILVFIASFFASTFLLLLWLLSPINALELFFVICLIPFFSISSGVFMRVESLELSGAVTRALGESVATSILLIIFSIIREPLGFLSLSIPGGVQGIITFFEFKKSAFFPIQIIASSCGALMLLGYGVSLYNVFRKRNAPREDIS